MAVDRGYGSGKPRSAANSRARQRVAKGQMTKGKKGNAALKKIAAENPITGFIGGGVAITKVLGAARALQASGRAAQAAPLFARVAAKVGGQIGKKASAKGNAGRGPFSMKNAFKEQSAVKTLTGRDLTSQGAREASQSAYPRLPSRGGDAPSLLRGQRDLRTFDRYADLINEGAGRFKTPKRGR